MAGRGSRGRPTVPPSAQRAAWAVETTMYRALAVLRGVLLVNTLVVNLVKWDGLARPGLTALALGGMAAWTGVAAWAYDEPRRRRAPLLTLGVQSQAQLGELSTLPSFWAMSAVLAWGIRWGWPGGLVAAAAVSGADLVIRPEITQTNLGNVFLLMIGGPVVGYTAGLLKQMADERDRAERAAAAAAERARLARVVHDGVLQVLALVQRRGGELGREGAELGRLAGEQEVALRALVQQEPRLGDRDGAAGARDGEVDLADRLSRLQSRSVTVSVPGPVVVGRHVADELEAAVRACLDNVAKHVGAEAPAWVLLEDLGDELVVTVRDDGPGIPHGRLDEARDQGRLGVSQSIEARVADLGGRHRLHTGLGQGTEWELSLPITLRAP
jgi:signal transduction histidine kinase